MDESLAAIRVLDLSRLLPGPACSWYLQGLGATVDRLEPPGGGDYTRHLPPLIDGLGAFFIALNQGKRSLAWDLRDPRTPALIRQLVRGYDVLIEGFRPGVMEAAGIGPRVLLAENPRLVIARISGFGQTGPWAQRPGHDVNYVGVAGHFEEAARLDDGGAVLPSMQVADLSGALVAAMGIAAALVGRGRTGEGRVLDVSLTEAALSVGAHQVAIASAGGSTGLLSGALPFYGTYACADGQLLTLGALEPKFQAQVTAQLGPVGSREELARALASRARDEWVALLEEACAAEACAPGELALHPQLRARGALERVGRHSFVRPPLMDPGRRLGPAPRLGEHSQAILVDGGFSVEEAEELLRPR